MDFHLDPSSLLSNTESGHNLAEEEAYSDESDIQASKPASRKDLHGDSHLNVFVGQKFLNKKDCALHGIHLNSRSGICGNSDGATSIAVSGQYNDKDLGDTLSVFCAAEYMGTGGGSNPRKKDRKQTLDHLHNQWLLASQRSGLPVRVIRSAKANTRDGSNKWAPDTGVRYDGLYDVLEVKMQPHPEAIYDVCIAKLQRRPGQRPIPKTN